MARRLLPGGLRAQLATAIALVTALALGLSFLAVYRGTGARLQDGIDRDLRTRRVERDGHEVRLTAREFELLAYLARHPDQVLSREQILNAVWGFDFDPGTKVLEVYIGYLRRKLGDDDGDGPIETVRNAGYRLRAPRG